MHRPSFYAERFQRFMCNTVFKKIPCKYSTWGPHGSAGVPGLVLSSRAWGGGTAMCESIGEPAVLHPLFSPPAFLLCKRGPVELLHPSVCSPVCLLDMAVLGHLLLSSVW